MAQDSIEAIKEKLDALQTSLKAKEKEIPPNVFRVQQFLLGYDQLSLIYCRRLLSCYKAGSPFLDNVEKLKLFSERFFQYFQNIVCIVALKQFLNGYHEKVTKMLESEEIGAVLDNQQVQRDVVEWMESYDSIGSVLENVHTELIQYTFALMSAEELIKLKALFSHPDMTQFIECCASTCDKAPKDSPDDVKISLNTNLYLSALQRALGTCLKSVAMSQIQSDAEEGRTVSDVKNLFGEFVKHVTKIQPERAFCLDFSMFVEDKDIYLGTLGDDQKSKIESASQDWTKISPRSPRTLLYHFLSPRKNIASASYASGVAERLTQ